MFIIFFIFTLVIILINLGLIIRAWWKHVPDEHISTDTPYVSVLIPAYNEKKVLEETIRMLFLQTYENFEIILIDDGSTDGTLSFLIEKFNLISKGADVYTNATGRFTVLRTENEGKAQALNVGLGYVQHTQSEWVLTVDADTLVDTNCLEEMMRKKKEGMHAVTCMIGIANGNRNLYRTKIPFGLLPRIQWIDYLRTFVIFRNSMKDLDAVVIMPGSCTLLHIEALLDVGGWSSKTLTEDMELTLMFQKEGYKIQYLSEILGWTQCPTDWKDTGRQRRRWKIGMLQNISRFPTLFFQKNNKALTYFMMPYLWMSELVSPILETICVTLMILGLVDVIDIPVGSIVMIWAMIAITYTALTLAVIEFCRAKLDFPNGPTKLPRLLIITLVEGFTYHFVFLFWHMQAIFMWIRGGNSWNKVKRTSYEEVESIQRRKLE
jgi:cellulose synthase/poly-beta-1,6-N-acetylglucosamine synthase-like glycosyltransferase